MRKRILYAYFCVCVGTFGAWAVPYLGKNAKTSHIKAKVSCGNANQEYCVLHIYKNQLIWDCGIFSVAFVGVVFFLNHVISFNFKRVRGAPLALPRHWVQSIALLDLCRLVIYSNKVRRTLEPKWAF